MKLREIQTDDGVTLHADVFVAGKKRWGTAIVLHAMMVDRRSMDRPAGAGLASKLSDHGLEVWNCDFRGHGNSGSDGPWTYDDLVYRDIPALVEAARAANGDPVWIIGLSLGGHTSLASTAAGAVRPAGLVLLSANTWRPSLDRNPRRLAARHLAMLGMRALTRAAGRFPARRLRLGPADESAPYVEDLTRFWFDNRWADRDGLDWTAGLPALNLPVLSVVGRADRLLAHAVGARAFVEPVPGHRFAEIGRGDLGLDFDPGHMDLGADPRCEPVWHWVARWIRSNTES